MTTRTALYRHYDADGQLLYVGITNNPTRRLAEHKSRAVWRNEIDHVEVKWIGSREEALSAEAEAIRSEGPVFNGGDVKPYAPTGDVLRDWMGSVGITQAELAEEYGVTGATMSQMMNGKRRAPLHFAAFIEDKSEGLVPMRYWLFGATVERHKSSGAVVRLVAGVAQ